MRIVHVDSARGWRGGQNQVLLSAQGMAAAGHDVVVACQKGGVLEERARGAGLAVEALSFQGDISPAAVVGLRDLARRLRPQVVHAHDPHAVSTALLVARLASGPRLLAGRRVDFHLRGALSRWKYRSCQRVIAASRAIAQVLEADGIASPRVRVVYEGVPLREPQPGGRQALESLGVPAGAPVVGNVAALTDHKDHRTLLEAMAIVRRSLPEACLVIVGDGELRSALEARARALGLVEAVIFAGFRSDLDRLIPAFTVFCLSSHLEGLGTSLLDAMAFGLPIVATAAGGIPEAVVEGVTGRLVPPRDPQALAQALVAVLTDDPRRAEMGRAGRRRFEERFTAERMVGETLAVYQEVL